MNEILMFKHPSLYYAPAPVLISVRPKWAEKIRSLIKPWELRTRMCPDGEYYMYETAPVKRITAKFDMRCIGYTDRWTEQIETKACVDIGEFEQYKGTKSKYAEDEGIYIHEISNLKECDLSLGSFGLRRPPVSWMYLRS